MDGLQSVSVGVGHYFSKGEKSFGKNFKGQNKGYGSPLKPSVLAKIWLLCQFQFQVLKKKITVLLEIIFSALMAESYWVRLLKVYGKVGLKIIPIK